MNEFTCKNHPEGRWYQKPSGSIGRSLHWIGWFDQEGAQMAHPEFGPWKECPCPASDLVLIGGPDFEGS